MIKQDELLEAIRECETAPMSLQSCEKLATFYILYDHLFTEPTPRTEKQTVSVINVKESSEFLKAVNGMPSDLVFEILDELLETLRIINVSLYDQFINKLLKTEFF